MEFAFIYPWVKPVIKTGWTADESQTRKTADEASQTGSTADEDLDHIWSQHAAIGQIAVVPP